MNYVNNPEQIIEVKIPAQVKAQIEKKANRRGVLNSKTLIGGEGNLAGFAGEAIVQIFCPFLKKDTGNKDWDFISADGKVHFDAKAKGNSEVKPLPHFDCTVPMYQVQGQNCDVYIFTRIAPDLSRGWINGYINKQRFLKEGTLRKAGSKYNNEGRATIGEHLVIPICRLMPIEYLSEQLKKL